MKRNFIKVAASLGFAQLALLNCASAQDTTALKEVIVTSTKFDQKQSQTGKVITVIPKDVLEKSQCKTVSQLLSEQAGIYVVGAQGNIGKDKSLYMRGASTSYTPIMIDGIQVNDPSIIGAIFDLRFLSVDQIERIEILKGGQSTLYGSDAIAGVINIVTKRGGNRPLSVSVLGSAGSYGTYKGGLSASGGINKFSYSLSYSHLNADGISEAKSLGNIEFDLDRFIQDGFNASVSYAANEHFSISPFLRYQYIDSKYDAGAFSDAFGNKSFSHFLTTGLNSVFKSGGSKITLNYSYANTERTYRSAFDNGTYEGGMHLVDLFFNRKLSNDIQLLAGVENRFINVVQVGAPIKKPDANLFSAYSSLSLSNLADYFDLELGGRYNNHTDYGSNYTYSITPSVKFFENGFRLFGTVSTAFKAPTLTELYGAFGANPNLKAQKADNYEAGFLLIPNNNFRLRVTGFERYVKDAIVYTSGYVNLDKQDDWGAEIEPEFSSRYVTVKGFYAFIKGKTYSNNGNGQYVKADYLLRRPKHSLGLNIGVNPTKKVFTSVNFRNYGKRNDTYYDANFSKIDVVNGAYQLVDLYGDYKYSSRLRLFLNVNNILDEDYEEIAGYSALGINFMAGLSYKIK